MAKREACGAPFEVEELNKRACFVGLDLSSTTDIVSDYEREDLRRAASEAGAEAYVSKSDLLVLRDLLADGGGGKRRR